MLSQYNQIAHPNINGSSRGQPSYHQRLLKSSPGWDRYCLPFFWGPRFKIRHPVFLDLAVRGVGGVPGNLEGCLVDRHQTNISRSWRCWNNNRDFLWWNALIGDNKLLLKYSLYYHYINCCIYIIRIQNRLICSNVRFSCYVQQLRNAKMAT